MLDVSRRALDGLAAIERGGPDAWRVVTEFLRDVARAGFEQSAGSREEPTG
jgi:hypothetical protein